MLKFYRIDHVAQAVPDLDAQVATLEGVFGFRRSAPARSRPCSTAAPTWPPTLTSRFIAYEAIWRLAEGAPAEHEVSLAKAWVSEACQRVCAAGHQVHGAIGFTAEHPLHRYLRHAVAAATAFGDADFHTERIARDLGL